MNFKVSSIGYYVLMLAYMAVFMIWTGVMAMMILFLPQAQSLFGTGLTVLLILEGMLFVFSPFYQRTVTVTNDGVTEQWLFFTVKSIDASDITDSGLLCIKRKSGQTRQYVFLSAENSSKQQAAELLDKRRSKHLIVMDYPQNELDACLTEFTERHHIPYRELKG